MKKILIKIIPLIIAIVVLTIIAIFILNNVTKDEISKLSTVYEKMISNQTYIFTRYNLEEKNKFITSRKVNKTLIDIYNSGERFSTLIVDEDAYLIDYANKEYYIYSNNNAEAEILTENLKEISNLEYKVGKEKIYGKTYKYEEYNNVSEFLIFVPQNIDVNSIKTRFYFKGDELVYLKTIYDVIDEETKQKTVQEELQTVKVEFKVEDTVFEIPANFAEN